MPLLTKLNDDIYFYNIFLRHFLDNNCLNSMVLFYDKICPRFRKEYIKKYPMYEDYIKKIPTYKCTEFCLCD